MALSDRLVGGVMLLIAAFVFTYYSIWALITPFFPTDSPIQAYFPDRVWAVRGPALLLVAGLGGVGSFVGVTAGWHTYVSPATCLAPSPTHS
ncbi:unnamed protein product [Tilletia caries]|uniref:Dolichol phosphate-mannose biosynthesis regulatory protein n=1 Tax=Tilletia caries TaxID=13290 RepID=A0ABN7JBN6_9BASI|nr:unnamed protein product [Tilletia caries]